MLTIITKSDKKGPSHIQTIIPEQKLRYGLIPHIEEIFTQETLRRSKRLAKLGKANVDIERMQANDDYDRKYEKIEEATFPDFTQSDIPDLRTKLDDTKLLNHINRKSFDKAQKEDKQCQEIRKLIRKKEQNQLSQPKTQLEKDISIGLYHENKTNNHIIFKKNKFGHLVPIVPKTLQPQIIEYFHKSNCFHHQGVIRTQNTIKEYFHWDQMRPSIQQELDKCSACNLSKKKQQKHKGQRYPRIATRPFETISCDLVGALPITDKGNRYILTIMDRFTRYTVAVPLQRQTAEAVIQALLENWIYIYGAPEKILSDNGTQFASAIFDVVCKTLGIRQKFATVYHPEANGMIERFHQYMKQKLAIKAYTKQLDYWNEANWDTYLASIVYSYNASVHTVTNFAPFKLLYGRNVKLNIDTPHADLLKKIEYQTYEEYLLNFIQQLHLIRNHTFAIQYQKHLKLVDKLNKNKKLLPFQVGDWVSKRTYHKGSKGKLFIARVGPYEIIDIKPNGITIEIQHVKRHNIERIHGKHLCYYRKKIEDNLDNKNKIIEPKQRDNVEIQFIHTDEVISTCEEILGLTIRSGLPREEEKSKIKEKIKFSKQA